MDNTALENPVKQSINTEADRFRSRLPRLVQHADIKVTDAQCILSPDSANSQRHARHFRMYRIRASKPVRVNPERQVKGELTLRSSGIACIPSHHQSKLSFQ